MSEHLLISLTGIIVLGVSAQWLAWRAGVPSILLLLVFGVLVGPVGGWLHPDELFGSLLLPATSLAVALILYEGGLTLKISELKSVGGDVFRLVTFGAIVTWSITAMAAHWLLGFDLSLSALLGAILVVTGPTVIGPLLRLIRPTGAVGPLLKWEGIVIDPIGALLAVLIFEAIQIGNSSEATYHIILAVIKTLMLGGGLGFASAMVLIIVIERHWIADYLENAVSLMLVVGIFALSNLFQHESGLLAVTVMGFTLANQKRIDIGHIVEFKENLQVLLISTLFIILAARVELASLQSILVPGLALVGVLVLIVRPLAVLISTWRSTMSVKERWFIAWMAPRGIVAAAVAAVFAIRLEEVGYPGATMLVPVTFLTIISTVTIYGLTSPFVARKLGLAEANPQGILFAGAHEWTQHIATLLQREGFRVLLVDTNHVQIRESRMAGLPTYHGSILGDAALDRIDLGGMGRLLAVTPNDWVNVLAVRHFERIFGRSGCYQLPPHLDTSVKHQQHKHLHGRLLFSDTCDFRSLSKLTRNGFTPKATKLSDNFDYTAFREQYGELTVPLFVITQEGQLDIFTADQKADPQPGDTLISLVLESNDSSQHTEASKDSTNPPNYM